MPGTVLGTKDSGEEDKRTSILGETWIGELETDSEQVKQTI